MTAYSVQPERTFQGQIIAFFFQAQISCWKLLKGEQTSAEASPRSSPMRTLGNNKVSQVKGSVVQLPLGQSFLEQFHSASASTNQLEPVQWKPSLNHSGLSWDGLINSPARLIAVLPALVIQLVFVWNLKSANFYCKGPDSKSLTLCEPNSLICCKHSIQSL